MTVLYQIQCYNDLCYERTTLYFFLRDKLYAQLTYYSRQH